METGKVTKSLVRFNIRGTTFVTKRDTLQIRPGTLLYDLDNSSDAYDQENNEYYFDRDPEVFNVILNYFVNGKLHIPTNICGALIREEMDFWGLSYSNVSECCWKTFYMFDEHRVVSDDLKSISSGIAFGDDVDKTRLRYRIWMFLENPGFSAYAMIWSIFYYLVVVLGAVIFCIWTLPEMRTEQYLSPFNTSDFPDIANSSNVKLKGLFLYDPHPVLFAIDTFCMLTLTLELVIRLGVCPKRIQFLKTAPGAGTLLAIVSMWMSFLLEFNKAEMIKAYSTRVIYIIFKCASMFRLLLLCRLEKHFSGLRVLLMSIRCSVLELLLMVVTFIIATSIFGSIMYYAEIFEEGSFNNIFKSMWWAIITMTTVGYGDYYPTSTGGYLVGVVCAMWGLLLLALPVAIMATSFSDNYSRNKDRERCMKALQEEEKKCKLQNKKIQYVSKIHPDDRNS